MKIFDQLLGFIGIVAFVGTIITGLFGDKISSIVMIGLTIFIFLTWIFLELIRVRKKIENNEKLLTERFKALEEALNSFKLKYDQAYNIKWNLPNFKHDWNNYQHGKHNSVGFLKDNMGIVHLRGLVSNDNDTNETDNKSIFILPISYRPENHEIHIVLASYKTGRIDITPDGEVLKIQGETGDKIKNWISLDGITFRASN